MNICDNNKYYEGVNINKDLYLEPNLCFQDESQTSTTIPPYIIIVIAFLYMDQFKSHPF